MRIPRNQIYIHFGSLGLFTKGILFFFKKKSDFRTTESSNKKFQQVQIKHHLYYIITNPELSPISLYARPTRYYIFGKYLIN